MSTGITHRRASIILASAFGVGAIITLRPELAQCAVGSLVGIFISPDQDVDVGNISNKIIKKRVGWFGERVWRLFWSGYSSSFKHGQFASHFPVYGTFTRMLYLFLMLVVPFYAVYFLILLSVNYHFNLIFELLFWIRMLFMSWYVVGLCASDLIHFFLDKLTKNME